jgi:hypothetical protein
MLRAFVFCDETMGYGVHEVVILAYSLEEARRFLEDSAGEDFNRIEWIVVEREAKPGVIANVFYAE